MLLAAGIAVSIGRMMPLWGKMFTLVECIAVFLLYLVVLIVVREFKKDDIEQLGKIFRRRKHS